MRSISSAPFEKYGKSEWLAENARLVAKDSFGCARLALLLHDRGEVSILSFGGVGGGISSFHPFDAWRVGGERDIDTSALGPYNVADLEGVVDISDAYFATCGACIPLAESMLDD